MHVFKNRILLALSAQLALVVFAGDVLDDVWVPQSLAALNHTSGSSGQEKGTAPTNSSASHDDTVVISTPLGALIPPLPSAFRYVDIGEDALDGPPPSIDHPPQLA
jgi:hypothetical protein